MKRLISIILVLAMFLSCFVFAEELIETETVQLSNEFTVASGLLKAIGVADIEESNALTYVTRQEFVKTLYKLIINNEYAAEDTKSYYSDVDDPEYIPYINAMADLKIVSGFSDGTFAPEDNISVFEALTLIIRALGHTPVAEANGGYPYGYVTAAAQADILKSEKINTSVFLTKENMAIFFKRALTAELFERVITDNPENITYKKTEQTLLDSVYKIAYEQGVLEGIDYTMLYGDSTVPPWNIYINGKHYDIGKTNPENLLGMNVEMYYTYEDDTVIYIGEKSGKNQIVEFNINDIIDIKGNKITIEVDEKEFEYDYTISAFLIYNYASTREVFSADILKDKNGKFLNGTVTLINNDDSSGYDVIKVMAGRNVIVKSVDAINNEVIDFYTNERIKLDTQPEEPFVEIFDANGNMIEFSGIKKDDVLTVFETRDDASQKMIRVYVSSKAVTGKIIGLNEYDGIYIEFSSGIYKVAESAEIYIRDKASVNKSFKFFINMYDEIVGMTHIAGASMWGCVITAGSKTVGIETTAYIKIMGQDGVKNIYDMAENVTVDGVIFKDDKIGVLEYLEESSKADMQGYTNARYTQMLMFGTNNNGEINYLDTVLKNKDKMEDGSTLESGNSIYTIQGRESTALNQADGAYYSVFETDDDIVFVGDTAIVFLRPYPYSSTSEFRDEKNYYITTRSRGIVDHHKYTFGAYYDNANNMLCNIFCRSAAAGSAASIDSDSKISVVDRVTHAVSADGASVVKLYLYYNGTYTTKLAYEDVRASSTKKTLYVGDLKKGDAIIWGTDTDGIIDAVRYLYSAEDDIMHYSWNMNSTDSTGFQSNPKVIYGYAVRTYDDGFTYVREEDIKDQNGNVDLSILSNNYDDNPGNDIRTYKTYTGKTEFVHYSKSESKVDIATLTNLKSYEADGLNASKVLIHIDSARPYTIYIVNK